MINEAARAKLKIDSQVYKLTSAARGVIDAGGVSLDEYIYNEAYFVGAQQNGFTTHDDYMMTIGAELGKLAMFRYAVASGKPGMQGAADDARNELQKILAHNADLHEPAEDFVNAIVQAIDLRIPTLPALNPPERGR